MTEAERTIIKIMLDKITERLDYSYVIITESSKEDSWLSVPLRKGVNNTFIGVTYPHSALYSPGQDYKIEMVFIGNSDKGISNTKYRYKGLPNIAEFIRYLRSDVFYAYDPSGTDSNTETN